MKSLTSRMRSLNLRKIYYSKEKERSHILIMTI